MQHVKLIASGRVQNVGFRDFVCRIASSLSLVGYAKNLPDGTVEIVAEGSEAGIAQLQKRVSSIRLALGISVSSLEVAEKKKLAKPHYASFGVKY
ncbi:Acylphosphatase [uncultured archaeon]|nr:Acylphosphatase [uncultured archaeon]